MTTIMKLIKGLALAAVALLSLASCSEKYDEWNPGAADTGSQFYFSNATATAVTLTPATTSIDVPLYRVDTSSSSAAVVTVSEEETQYIIQSSPATFNVAFDSGSNVATLSIPVDMNNVPFGKSAKLNLTITGETTQYAVSNISITATLPEPWKNLGKGLWVDDIVCGLYGIDPITVPCTIYENELTPGLFKVEGFQLPLAAAILGATESQLKSYEGTYWRNAAIVVDATNPANVTIALQDYGVCINTSDGFIDGVTSLYKGNPFSVGTFADGIISFPTPKGMLCTLNGEGYYYADQHGKFAIVMPGVELSDYTIELTLEGILTDPSGADNALVNVEFVGADASQAAVVLVKGGDEDAIDYALDLVFVEDESVVLVDKPGMVKLPFPEDAEGGKYTVVAVPISDKGQEDDYAVYTTIQYGLGPFEIAYTEDDFVAGVAKAKLLGTTWIMWATDDEGAAVDREPYSLVTFTDAVDKVINGDDCDIVLASGFDSGIGEQAGFNGDIEMEWYNGYLYKISNAAAGEVVYGSTTYTVVPVAMDYEAETYSTGNYGMVGAYVADGLIAIVSNSSTYDFTAIEFAAFVDSEYAGYFATANYILLADPEVYPLNYSSPAEIQKIKAQAKAKLTSKKYQLFKGETPRNFVELPQKALQAGVHKVPVIASGKAHTTKGDVQAQRANL